MLQRLQQHAPGRGQFEVMVAALQQRLAELLLQLAHLPADRALRDVQQFGCAGETPRATGHFEGFERVQRGHFSFQGRLWADAANRSPFYARVRVRPDTTQMPPSGSGLSCRTQLPIRFRRSSAGSSIAPARLRTAYKAA